MTSTETVKQLRNKLGAYLSTPVEIESGKLSTQQNLPATSLSQGGLTRRIVIGAGGSIVILRRDQTEAVILDENGFRSNDGTNNRVKIGDIS